MLLTIDIEAKTIGNKELFKNLRFVVEPGQKVGVIGRNGVGKTTLFNMLAGKDSDFSGQLQMKRGTRLVSTAQEHHDVEGETVLHYVLHNLPEYDELKHIIDTYPATMGDNMTKIHNYSEALERFSNFGYYYVEEKIVQTLQSYQISEAMAHGLMSRLSGGQKRFVELVRVEHADADIILIDEPTNHMDYIAKASFIDWLQAAKQAVLVITHDRDVLQNVDVIVELRDGGARTFKGNYGAYLKQNATSTTAQMHDYQVALKTLESLHKRILWARARKPSWHGTADQRNPFEVMERRLQKEYDQVKAANPKPSFWIDRESAEGLAKKVGEDYQKFKARNIRINKTEADRHLGELLNIEKLSLGYDGSPLFAPVSFRLQHGERLHIVGRNGAGKTTLVRAIIAASAGQPVATLLGGEIKCHKKLRLSMYEQEVRPDALQSTLYEAIETILRDNQQPVVDQTVKRLMSDYLFDPTEDAKLRVEQLSGGQKARLQIIRMLANNPNLLILDEPTNHLDLPSIEELEDALGNYPGAILYVTHDSYFAANLGGDELALVPPT